MALLTGHNRRLWKYTRAVYICISLKFRVNHSSDNIGTVCKSSSLLTAELVVTAVLEFRFQLSYSCHYLNLNSAVEKAKYLNTKNHYSVKL